MTMMEERPSEERRECLGCGNMLRQAMERQIGWCAACLFKDADD